MCAREGEVIMCVLKKEKEKRQKKRGNERACKEEKTRERYSDYVCVREGEREEIEDKRI